MTREQVIEAVARAICRTQWASICEDDGPPIDETVDMGWSCLKDEATAALTAVLDATAEPTRGMGDAGDRVTGAAFRGGHQAEPEDVWRAMHAVLRRKLTQPKTGE